MTTCRDVITMGLRFARILPSGKSPKASEAADGLFVLQGMYDHMVSAATFGQMTDVIATQAMTAEPQQRIRNLDDFAITLPSVVDDQYPPYDLSIVQVITSTGVETSIYEAMRGDWVRIDNLTLDTEAPLATRGAHGLASLFATRWAETFGADLPPSIIRNAMDFNGSLIGNKAADSARIAAEYF